MRRSSCIVCRFIFLVHIENFKGFDDFLSLDHAVATIVSTSVTARSPPALPSPTREPPPYFAPWIPPKPVKKTKAFKLVVKPTLDYLATVVPEKACSKPISFKPPLPTGPPPTFARTEDEQALADLFADDVEEPVQRAPVLDSMTQDVSTVEVQSQSEPPVDKAQTTKDDSEESADEEEIKVIEQNLIPAPPSERLRISSDQQVHRENLAFLVSVRCSF